ncbi:hypothetical protein FD754_001622, partial [Muntiacus muntjak]
ADYWKSQPKKFCDYCNIEFHERGKNHKENKSLDKAKEEEKASKEFISEPSVSPVTSTIPPTSASNQQKEKKKKKKDPSKGRWVEGITSECHHYYYDLITGESRWEKPDDFIPHSCDMPSSKVNEKSLGTLEESKSSDSHSESDGEQEAGKEKKKRRDLNRNTKANNKKENNTQGKNSSGPSEEKPKEKNTQGKNSSGPNEEKPKAHKKPNPYGEWQEIKPEVDTENEHVSTSEADATGEPQLVFKEKTVTSLGVVADGVAPVFKKRRIENGKSRNLRQRGDDQ